MKSYRFDSASSPAAFCTIWARYLICVLWVKDLWIWSIFIYWQSRGQTVWKKRNSKPLKEMSFLQRQHHELGRGAFYIWTKVSRFWFEMMRRWFFQKHRRQPSKPIYLMYWGMLLVTRNRVLGPPFDLITFSHLNRVLGMLLDNS